MKHFLLLGLLLVLGGVYAFYLASFQCQVSTCTEDQEMGKFCTDFTSCDEQFKTRAVKPFLFFLKK